MQLKIHEEALTTEAKYLLPLFQNFKDFYLVGGTALALQIGHRLSVDFDFFSYEWTKTANVMAKVKRIFIDAKPTVTYNSPEQLNLITKGVKTTFFHYQYPVIRNFVKYKNINIVEKSEIAAMKAFSIGKRLSYKDYIDWYFLLKENHTNLETVIELAKKKFGGDFNDRLFLGQLVSMDDITTQKIDFLRDEVERKTVEKFLKKTVGNFKL